MSPGEGGEKIYEPFLGNRCAIFLSLRFHGDLFMRSAEVGRHEEIPISSKEGNI